MKLKRMRAIALLGISWFGVGLFLLYKGIFLLVHALTFDYMKNQVVIREMKRFVNSSEHAAIMILSFALFLGIIKGRFILGRTARRTVSRILQTPEPISLKEIFPPKYLVLVAFMISLGFFMNRSSLSFDIRGIIDVAVGSALIQGGMQYFRSALQLKYIKS